MIRILTNKKKKNITVMLFIVSSDKLGRYIDTTQVKQVRYK